MTEKMFWTNDLFCGAGGMGLGFKNAGFRLAGAWDFDKYAVESYGNNVSPKVKRTDITQMKWDDLPKADVWTFGFPCQDLSIAGKQAGMKLKCSDCEHEFKVVKDEETNCPECGSDNTKAASRSGLFFEVMRLLDETIENDVDRLPDIIMAENVKGLKPYLEVLKAEYNKRGYRMTYTLYNSKYWGVPQNRERYFVVGIRETIRKAFQFPRQQTDFVPKLSSILETDVDEKYYIDDLKAAKIIEQAISGLKRKPHIKSIENTVNQKPRGNNNGGIFDVHPTITKSDSQENHHLIEKPKSTKDSTEQPKIEMVGSLDVNWNNDRMKRVFSPEGISPTVTTDTGGWTQIKILEGKVNIIGNIGNTEHGGENVYDPNGIAPTAKARDYKGPIKTVDQYRVRKLTPREYARLQSFPNSYKQVVSNSQFYKQMGNAVTVNVSQAIAEKIKIFLEGVYS